MQVCTLPQFLDQWRSITCTRFVLNMVKGQHLQLSHPPLFYNFKWSNIKVAAAHHPVIQKEVNKLLAKGTTEPFDGAAGIYSNVYMVPKYMDGLWLILYLKWSNCYMHICAFKMLTIRQVWQPIQQGNYTFCIELKDMYLHIPVVKCHHLTNHLLIPYCYFPHSSVVILLYIWMIAGFWFIINM